MTEFISLFSLGMVRSLFTKMAIRDPSMRDKLKNVIPADFNWEATIEEDKKTSLLLKKIFIDPYPELLFTQKK